MKSGVSCEVTLGEHRQPRPRNVGKDHAIVWPGLDISWEQ